MATNKSTDCLKTLFFLRRYPPTPHTYRTIHIVLANILNHARHCLDEASSMKFLVNLKRLYRRLQQEKHIWDIDVYILHLDITRTMWVKFTVAYFISVLVLVSDWNILGISMFHFSEFCFEKNNKNFKTQ